MAVAVAVKRGGGEGCSECCFRPEAPNERSSEGTCSWGNKTTEIRACLAHTRPGFPRRRLCLLSLSLSLSAAALETDAVAATALFPPSSSPVTTSHLQNYAVRIHIHTSTCVKQNTHTHTHTNTHTNTHTHKTEAPSLPSLPPAAALGHPPLLTGYRSTFIDLQTNISSYTSKTIVHPIRHITNLDTVYRIA